MGRPRTGRTTRTLGIRLPLDQVEKLERRAAQLGLAPTAWAAQILMRELKHRPGEATRRRHGLEKRSDL